MDAEARLFLRVVEAGSLKAAAQQLRTDPSTVSRRLRSLETRLGVKLMQRSTRRSTPTEAGRRYYEGLRRLAAQLDALEAEVTGTADRPQGHLRVAAAVDFGPRFVVPVIERLQRTAPELHVELVLGSGFADLVEEGIDVAIRIGRLPDSSHIARRLGQVPRVLVGAPSYLEERGRPTDVPGLADHDFVFYRRSNADTPLTLVDPQGRTVSSTIKGRAAVNSVTGIRQLVLAGVGLTYGPRWAFEDDIRTGAVVSLLTDHLMPSYPLHALYPESPYVPAKVRAFVDAMAAEAKQQPTLQ